MIATGNTVSVEPRAAMPAGPGILYFTPFWPHLKTFGSELRSHQMLRALEQVGRVEVVVVTDEQADELEAARGAVASGMVRWLDVQPRPNSGLGGKLRWLLDPRASYPHGCGVSENSAHEAVKLAGGFDLVWFFKLRTPNLFPNGAWPRSVVDIDDVPSTFERAEAVHAASLGRRLHANVRAWSWRRRERLLGERFSALGVCSEGDRDYLRDLGVRVPIHVLPNGTECPAVEPQRQPADPPRLGFIGLLDYEANREGIAWFARECWPLIKARVPRARLRLVGRGSDGPLKPAGPDIDGLGFLPEVAGEIATWSASVVPIRLGAGTRIKIAQGFAQKCPLVSTTLGAFGYEVADGRELFLADAPEKFADACVRLIEQPDIAQEMAGRAWRRLLENWTWEAIAPRVHAAAAEVLRQNAKR
jgi:glycosyltransferase involved in cell wall biosynthesis